MRKHKGVPYENDLNWTADDILDAWSAMTDDPIFSLEEVISAGIEETALAALAYSDACVAADIHRAAAESARVEKYRCSIDALVSMLINSRVQALRSARKEHRD